MFRADEDREIRWAREHFPLLALRNDTEVRRIVRIAREQMRAVQFAITFAGCVLGAFLGNWIQSAWSDSPTSKSGELLFLMAASALLGGVCAIASQSLLRKRVETLANDDSRFF